MSSNLWQSHTISLSLLTNNLSGKPQIVSEKSEERTAKGEKYKKRKSHTLCDFFFLELEIGFEPTTY